MTDKYKMVDYRKFRFSKINDEEFSHLKLLLYWVVFGALFYFVERVYPVKEYYSVHCRLDDLIPFNEYFLPFYLFWFVFLVVIHIYTLLFDVECFKKLMKFIMVTYSTAIIIYFIFPTCQDLRPVSFERDNIFTDFLYGFYAFDTNTNVCPSIHVIGSLAVVFASWHTKRFQSIPWKIAFTSVGIMICISTMFLKQHSVIDVVLALPVSFIAYYFIFKKDV